MLRGGKPGWWSPCTVLNSRSGPGTTNMESYIQPAFRMIIAAMVNVIALAVYLP